MIRSCPNPDWQHHGRHNREVFCCPDGSGISGGISADGEAGGVIRQQWMTEGLGNLERKRAVGDEAHGTVMRLVAGAGFEPATFGL